MELPQIFKYGDVEVRTVVIDGQPYFVGKDIAEVLGYKDTNNALKQHVDPEDKIKGDQNTTPSFIDSMGRKQYPSLVNESGLYDLIFGSQLPTAKTFKKWVTSEVLPSIRKHGLYAAEELINNPDLLVEVAQNLKKEREINTALMFELEQHEPILDYYHEILQSRGTMTITQIAQDYGMSAYAMNKLLKKLKIQRKVNDQWILLRPYIGKGYTKSETRVVQNGTKTVIATRWTQKGRLFLYERLKSEGTYPIQDGGNDNE